MNRETRDDLVHMLRTTLLSQEKIANSLGIKAKTVSEWGYKYFGKAFMAHRRKLVVRHANYRYNGGVTEDKDGYILITAPDWWEGTRDRVYAYEHHVMWCTAQNLRRVPPNTIIHHIDCNHRNNAPDNLIAMTPEAHRYLHKTLKVCEADRV